MYVFALYWEAVKITRNACSVGMGRRGARLLREYCRKLPWTLSGNNKQFSVFCTVGVAYTGGGPSR